ncbi:chaperonin GroES [Blastomyces silverae]|uniref:20 kDa chaperonin, chloroplastic n=1 Tax=Blastomyces silverae TaxID=2060906 RepID=A0A0H1B5I7_9EURO|nr:chaperonin GroES [Blastomyces silverae]
MVRYQFPGFEPFKISATALRSVKNLVPLLDRVLVQRVKAEAKTASGIFLPESSVKELNQGKVLAVGPGALDKKGNRIAMGVTVGDKVLIPQVCHPHKLSMFG